YTEGYPGRHLKKMNRMIPRISGAGTPALPWRGVVARDGWLSRQCPGVSRAAIVWRLLALVACVLASFVEIPPAAAQMSAAGASHVMIVGTKVAPPFAIKSEDGSWSGISIELWRRIAADLHLSYRFEEVSLDELINGTAAHRLDAAVAAITVTATRAESVDFTQPYYATSLGITVRRVSVFNWLNLTESLFSLSLLKMLLLLVAAAILMGFVVWLIERRHTEHFGGGVKQGLGSSPQWSAPVFNPARPGER